jgi:hypothetical protein
MDVREANSIPDDENTSLFYGTGQAVSTKKHVRGWWQHPEALQVHRGVVQESEPPSSPNCLKPVYSAGEEVERVGASAKGLQQKHQRGMEGTLFLRRVEGCGRRSIQRVMGRPGKRNLCGVSQRVRSAHCRGGRRTTMRCRRRRREREGSSQEWAGLWSVCKSGDAEVRGCGRVSGSDCGARQLAIRTLQRTPRPESLGKGTGRAHSLTGLGRGLTQRTSSCWQSCGRGRVAGDGGRSSVDGRSYTVTVSSSLQGGGQQEYEKARRARSPAALARRPSLPPLSLSPPLSSLSSA